MNTQEKKKLKKYIINISVLTSTIVLIIASLYTEYMDKIIQDLIAPFFSIDMDNDGKPDLQEIRNFNLKLGKIQFPVGNLLYNILILSFKLLVLYYIVNLLINKVKIPK